MAGTSTALWALLPEYLRRSDVERGGPLAALLGAAEEQARRLHDDIGTLWKNFFVETCDAWVLPYIADLIAANLVADDGASTRRDVARTIAYRRRKGTVPQLETMARDVTGYDCRVVEFFERLLWTQSMIHVKPKTLWTADVRDRAAMGRVGTAFDRTCHTVDLRPSTQRHGWHAIRKLGFFLWRLHAIPLIGVPAAPAPPPAPAGRAFHLNVLGQPAPLFQSPPKPEPETDADWPRATELDVVSPISPLAFRESPDVFRQEAQAFVIHGTTVDDKHIVPANLCVWTEPDPGTVAVDVRLGRVLFAADVAPAAKDMITTDHHFGFSGEIGGGGYARSTQLAPLPGEAADVVHVSAGGAVKTIAAALAQLAGSTAALRVVQIDDSATYDDALLLPATFDQLVIQAGDRQRPLLRIGAGTTFAGPTRGTRLTLSGLLVTGAGRTLVLPPGVDTYVFEDCTIDPGGGVGPDGVSARPTGVRLRVAPPGAGITLQITRSIVGALHLPRTMECLALSDSIADGQAFPGGRLLAGGPAATVLRSTLLGTFHCQRLEASDSIFRDRTLATHRQEGCVRFSYFGPGSLVPRRFECAPPAPPPIFTSTLFGHPAYTQLALACPDTIATGGEDGREIGVWSSLAGPRRLAHLQLRLTEYLPAGLVPALVFVT